MDIDGLTEVDGEEADIVGSGCETGAGTGYSFRLIKEVVRSMGLSMDA